MMTDDPDAHVKVHTNVGEAIRHASPDPDTNPPSDLDRPSGQTSLSLTPSDRQVGGSHYKHFKIQPFEFFIANNIPFHKAEIIKRILRYDMPTGGA